MKMEFRTIMFAMLVLLFSQTVYAYDQPSSAGGTAYTRDGTWAVTNLLYLDKARRFYREGDYAAMNKMIKQGELIIFKEGIKVYYEKQPAFGYYTVEIHLPGSTAMLWTNWIYLKDFDLEHQKQIQKPVSRIQPKSQLVLLKSLSWIKVDKTTRQEIVQKYGNPDKLDEAGGEYGYRTNRHQDFKEWQYITFIFDGAVLAEIRAEK